MNKKMQDASKRISTLESLLERAERDAKVKSEQVCVLYIQKLSKLCVNCVFYF